MTFHDEFDGAAGASPKRPWVFDIGGEPQWGNHECEYYTKSTDNVSTDGSGHLAITARNKANVPAACSCQNSGACNITSGRITTEGTFSQQYGRMEARIKVPGGQGMWPAFWMLGDEDGRTSWPDSGEIDVMEIVGKDTRTVEGTGHGSGFPEDGVGGDATLSSGDFTDGFHTFAVEWTKDKIVWSVDGRNYFTLSRTGLPRGAAWSFDRKFHLLLNLAVGGDMPGNPTSSTPYPSTMLVDYVRVYSKS